MLPSRALSRALVERATAALRYVNRAATRPALHLSLPDRTSPLACVAPEFRQGQLLGPTTKSPSDGQAEQPTDGQPTGDERRRQRRDERFALRDSLQRHTTMSRIAACGRRRVSTSRAPEVVRRRRSDTAPWAAHFAHVQLCGAIWLCPVCSPRIRDQRAKELDRACAWWMGQAPGEGGRPVGSVMLLTLTMRHIHGDTLAGTFAATRAAFAALVSGRAWQADKARYGIEHYVRAHDCTVGLNGWHPHIHIVLFGARVLSDVELTTLADRLHARWSAAMLRRNYKAPSRKRGVTLERARCRTDVSRYVCQVVCCDADADHADSAEPAARKPWGVAQEVARGDLKTTHREGHRTPWQVLADIASAGAVIRQAPTYGAAGELVAADDAQAAALTSLIRDLMLWKDWERESKGVRAIMWSRGLRGLVGLKELQSATEDEAADQEAVAVTVGGETVFVFGANAYDWLAVCGTRGARAAVLRAAEEGGREAVVAAVDRVREQWMRRLERKAKARGHASEPARHARRTPSPAQGGHGEARADPVSHI